MSIKSINPANIYAMKTNVRILAVIFFFIAVLSASGQVSQVQYEVIYNPASCLYEAHAHVIGASLAYPSTIPYPSKFSVVVPAAISNLAFTVVQNVNPPGMSWSQSNNIYEPAAAPGSDFHAFTLSGGGGGNAYPLFAMGTDILLFKFSVPNIACENSIRCFINGVDPNSAQPGMAGLDFSQAFKTYQPGVSGGVNRYISNTGNPVSLPIPAATSSASFSPDGSILQLAATGSSVLGCDNTVSYNWAGPGGFTSPAQNPSVTTNITPGTYTVTVMDHNGCTNASSTVVAVPAGNVSGYVVYDNVSAEGINGVTVDLRNSSNVLVATTVTATNSESGQPGYYSFSSIAGGPGYKLSGTFSGSWGGNNGTDDLIVQLNIIGTYPLAELKQVVADVNGSTTVTGLDALFIKLRTLGSVTNYPAGDWKISEAIVDLSGSPVTQGLTALCVGDVNGSYSMGGTKAAAFLSLEEDGVMTVPVGESFTYTIRSSSAADLGAMTLFLKYDRDRFEVLDLSSAANDMKYVAGDGKIAIVWADTKPLNVNDGDVLFSVNMKVKEKISGSSPVFTIGAGSEFADISANPYENFNLKVSKVQTPDGSQALSMGNYPNPFVNSTSITYTLPASGHVRLVLMDLVGNTIRTLADREENAGVHNLSVDAAALQLAPGVYLYRMTYDNAGSTVVKAQKMVVTR